MNPIYRNIFLQLHPSPICSYSTRCLSDWKDFDITCNFNKLYYFLEGEATLVINGHTYHPNPGQLFVIPAKVKHSYWHNIEHPVYKYWSHFNSDTCAGIALTYHPESVCITPPVHIFKPLYEKLLACNSYANPFDTFTELSLFNELLQIYFSMVDLNKVLPMNQTNFVTILHSYIEEHYQETITITELAKLVNLQPNYFIQSFKKHFKDTPINYINSFRMDQAIGYLTANNELSIQEIALLCGFCDSRYFSRLFKKKYGMPPSVYRT